MSIEIKVPAFPESVADGTLTTWHKKPGDTVHYGDVLVDIETDKVIFEVPSLGDGVIDDVLVKEGEVVLSEQVIAHMTKQPVGKKQESSAVEINNLNDNTESKEDIVITPSAQKMINENSLDAKQIIGTGKAGRVLKEDVISYIENKKEKIHLQLVL